MPTRSQCFLVLLTGGALLCGGAPQLGCGARSGINDGPGHGPLAAADAGVAEPIGIDPGSNARQNVPSGAAPSDGSSAQPRPTVGAAPGTMPGAITPGDDPGSVPSVPGSIDPGSVTPSPDVEPEPLAAPLPTGPDPELPVEPEATPADGDPIGDPIGYPVGDPNAPRLWVYVNDGAGRLINAYDDREQFTVPAVDPNSALLKPWSNDGRSLSLFYGTTLSFQDLVSGQEISSNDTGTQMDLFGWVEGYGALVAYYYEARPVLYLGDPAGGFVILGQTPELSLATRATSSPTGTGLLYATEYDGAAHIYWVDLAAGASPPLDLLEASSDALTLASWSPDGRWAAFNDGDGLLWLVDTEQPSILVEMGAATSEAAFSPSGNAAALWVGNTIELFELVPGDTPVATTLSGARSAARFSPDGAWLYFAETGNRGTLRSASDPDGSALVIDGFDYDCPLVWTGADRFVYQQCGSPKRALAEAVVGPDGLATTVYDDALLDNLVIGPEQRCFVNWGEQQLDVGTTRLPLVTEFTRSPQVEITMAALSPSDGSLVWVEGARDVYWLPLNADCTVSSLPTLIHSGAEVSHLSFVAEWP